MGGLDLAVDDKPDDDAGDKQKPRQQLGDTDVPDQQRVGPQPFDDHPFKAIPAKVHQENLPVKPAALGIEVEQDKAQKAPDRFVKEAGVHRRVRVDGDAQLGQGRNVVGIRQVGDNPVAGHPPGEVGVAAEGLAVDKVAPAADPLPNQEPEGGQVHDRQDPHLVDAGDDTADEESAYNAAVDGHAALPGVPDSRQVVLILVPGEDDVVGPRPDDAADQPADDDVDQLVAVDAEPFAVFEGHQKRQQDVGGDDDAVPGYVDAADRKGDRV